MQAIRINNLIFQGRLKEALESIEHLENADFEAKAMKSYVLISMGKFQASIANTEKILLEAKEKKDQKLEIIGNILKATALWKMGYEREAALLFDPPALDILSSSRRLLFWKAMGHNTLGNIQLNLGDYDAALDQYKLSLEIAKEIDDLFMVAVSLNNHGEIFKIRGDLETALSYYRQSEDYLSHTNYSPILGVVLNNLGELSQLLGKPKEAEQFFLQSLKVKEHLGNPVILSETLLKLIILMLEMDYPQRADLFFKQLQSLDRENDIYVLHIKTKVAEGLIEKHKRRMISISNAQNIFQGLSEDPNTPIEYTIMALLNLCDLLILELKTYEQDDVLDEIKEIINKLYTIGETTASFKLLIEILILKAKVSYLEGNSEDTFLMLDDAMQEAKQRNLLNLFDMIADHKKAITEELGKWIDIIQESSLRVRIEKIKIEDYLNDLVKEKSHNT